MTTIFAPSTGMPPAAIAIVRISGPDALIAARTLAGSLPLPREARVRTLRHPVSGDHLDRALVLVFSGPATATGEDLVELHVHGGRAVVAAIESALASLPGLRRAEAGEFTRRALANGRIDLAEAEGLGDLLTAETELQRRAALTMADGRLSRQIAAWRSLLLGLAAQLEATLDFSDEADVPAALLDEIRGGARSVGSEIAAMIAMPTVERLRDGISVVLAGPPNSGKSTLFNALVQREAAIVSPVAGTTRDRIEVAVARNGVPFTLIDTAGLREAPQDEIEQIGIARAGEAIDAADIVVWLGDDPPPSATMIWLHARADLPGRATKPVGPTLTVSAKDNASVDLLWDALADCAFTLIPKPGSLALNIRQTAHCHEASTALFDVENPDEMLVADALRRANGALARITGEVGVEAMLDTLFGKFCIGK